MLTSQCGKAINRDITPSVLLHIDIENEKNITKTVETYPNTSIKILVPDQ